MEWNGQRKSEGRTKGGTDKKRGTERGWEEQRFNKTENREGGTKGEGGMKRKGWSDKVTNGRRDRKR